MNNKKMRIYFALTLCVLCTGAQQGMQANPFYQAIKKFDVNAVATLLRNGLDVRTLEGEFPPMVLLRQRSRLIYRSITSKGEMAGEEIKRINQKYNEILYLLANAYAKDLFLYNTCSNDVHREHRLLTDDEAAELLCGLSLGRAGYAGVQTLTGLSVKAGKR